MGGSAANTEAGWVALGHTVNVLILVQAVVYTVLTTGHVAGHWTLDVFGENWARDGFCLSYTGTLYHTHLLCLYGDFVLAAVLYALARGSKRSEIAYVMKGIPSTLLHGLGHGFLWWETTHRTYAPTDHALNADASMFKVFVVLAGMTVFWTSFLAVELPLPVALAESVFLSYYFAYHVPGILAFSFINTALNFNLTGVMLLKGVEGAFDKYYALIALCVGLPLNAAAWAEPLLCDSFLVRWGGHIIFDYCIPTGLILYVLLAKLLPPREASKLE